MPFYVYILRCRDNSYYVGQTDDLDKRMAEHQSGVGCDWTRRRRPVELAYHERFPTREEARAAEARIKPWSRVKKEALIRGDWASLKKAAKGKHWNEWLEE